jgi:thioredoxin 1
MENKATFSEIINGNLPVLVDFHATWCGPCQLLKPVLENTAVSWKDRLRIIKIDVDKNESAANAYKVQGVPTLILFHNGKILWRQSGFMNETQLNTKLEQFIS